MPTLAHSEPKQLKQAPLLLILGPRRPTRNTAGSDPEEHQKAPLVFTPMHQSSSLFLLTCMKQLIAGSELKDLKQTAQARNLAQPPAAHPQPKESQQAPLLLIPSQGKDIGSTLLIVRQNSPSKPPLFLTQSSRRPSMRPSCSTQASQARSSTMLLIPSLIKPPFLKWRDPILSPSKPTIAHFQREQP